MNLYRTALEKVAKETSENQTDRNVFIRENVHRDGNENELEHSDV